jgi:serine acetyltransferase/GT2 family glycosyltransferase
MSDRKSTLGRRRTAAGKQASVIIATYNRGAGLVTLLDDLVRQTLDAALFEVVVNDDGSTTPVAAALAGYSPPYALKLLRQNNAGAASARHRAILEATGEIIVIVDDDMRVGADFLAEHLRAHAAGADVVLGQIRQPAIGDRLALFERFHTQQIEANARRFASGRAKVRGVHLCTGNLSIRRDLYLRAGGFDTTLPRSEDRELGIRLEKLGARLAFSETAATDHHSDHASRDSWLERAHRYGIWDARIGEKHPEVENADPWRFLFLVSPLSRPILSMVVAAPAIGKPVARGIMSVAEQVDDAGFERPAIVLATLAYGVEYFRGVRENAGSLSGALQGLRLYRHKRARETTMKKDPVSALARFARAVQADYGSVQRNRAKYHKQVVKPWQLPMHLVQKIGLQMSFSVRLMQLFRDAGIPLLPQVASRMIRHLYGAEIHWDAQIAPGISIVHGNGLVIGHGGRIDENCILFHNVTLGEGIDPNTRAIGTPILEHDVHVGPGATIVGPITVGHGSKVMAGAVLAESVPPNSLVMAGQARIEARARAKNLTEPQPGSTPRRRGRRRTVKAPSP